MNRYKYALKSMLTFIEMKLEQCENGKITVNECEQACNGYVKCLMINDLIGDGFGMRVLDGVSEALKERK